MNETEKLDKIARACGCNCHYHTELHFVACCEACYRRLPESLTSDEKVKSDE